MFLQRMSVSANKTSCVIWLSAFTPKHIYMFGVLQLGSDTPHCWLDVYFTENSVEQVFT